jgi:hypothetical protein
MLELKHCDRTLQSMVPEEMKRWSVRPCTNCEGTGLCLRCKDPEKRKFLKGKRHRKAEETCHACDGSKRCRACAGTGRVGGVGSSQPVPAGPTSQPLQLTRSERVAVILDLLSGRTSLPACRDQGLPVSEVARWLIDFLEAGAHAVATEPCEQTSSTSAAEEQIHELSKQTAPIIGHEA